MYVHAGLCYVLVNSPDLLYVSVSKEIPSRWQQTVEELLYRQTVTSLDEVTPVSETCTHTHTQYHTSLTDDFTKIRHITKMLETSVTVTEKRSGITNH